MLTNQSYHFTQFEIDRGLLVDICVLDDVLPESEKHNYAYQPSPAERTAPISSNVLIHLFSYPQEAAYGIAYLDLDRLVPCPVKGHTYGWGLQIVDDVSKQRVCVWGMGLVLVSALVGIVVATKAKDWKLGITAANYLTATSTITMGALSVLSKR